ncbi:hypothetical protein BOX15_Mlig018523g2, partial [Macrostomum lignano]
SISFLMQSALIAILGVMFNLLAMATAEVVFYPELKTSGCEWSEWQCKEHQTECILFREKNCSSFILREYDQLRQGVKGISCRSQYSFNCLSEPRFLSYTSFHPMWCSWQSWQSWSYACIDAILEKHSWLSSALSEYEHINNGSLWLRQRSRHCRCPKGRYGTQCSGPSQQVAFTPRTADLAVNGELLIPASRQSAWCPWSAWSDDCSCLSQIATWVKKIRKRVCQFGTPTASGCSGSAIDTQLCWCEPRLSSSSSTTPKRNSKTDLGLIFSKPMLIMVSIPLGVLLCLCCICRATRRSDRLQQQQRQREQQQQQQQEQELLQSCSLPPPAGRGTPSAAPPRIADDSSLNPPPPSYEEAIKLVTQRSRLRQRSLVRVSIYMYACTCIPMSCSILMRLPSQSLCN